MSAIDKYIHNKRADLQITNFSIYKFMNKFDLKINVNFTTQYIVTKLRERAFKLLLDLIYVYTLIIQ